MQYHPSLHAGKMIDTLTRSILKFVHTLISPIFFLRCVRALNSSSVSARLVAATHRKMLITVLAIRPRFTIRFKARFKHITDAHSYMKSSKCFPDLIIASTLAYLRNFESQPRETYYVQQRLSDCQMVYSHAACTITQRFDDLLSHSRVF